ncbi:FecR domain-containing protein [Chitinophaga sp. MM2321]|uniref:FecR family protein n=1 Tax=Chitinophaga sp. MM2321 TaxID=3137178 RepID=UPI0032D57D51
MQIPEQLRKAIDNYLAGMATPLEKQQVNDWFYAFHDEEVEVPADVADLRLQLQESMRAGIRASIQQHEKAAKPALVIFLWKHRWIAAASILFLACSSYFYFNRTVSSDGMAATAHKTNFHMHDVAPGGNKAVLILADGSNIVLDSARNGTLIQQGKTKISKPEDGRLTYSPGQSGTAEILYNTIATPRGGEYELVLADGTKVWMNAASSLHFPTTFHGKERRVVLTGEAYFEVAKNPDMPFKVTVNDMEVAVLGTHFNVNAYTDENSIRTTLLEGAVKVTATAASTGQQPMLLKPGQQAQVNKEGQLQLVKNVNVDVATAWKNGRFEFDDNSLPSVMRQITRWYNVDVVYEGNIPDISFSGAISRQENVSQVLTMLELTHMIRFRLEGKTIHIMR